MENAIKIQQWNRLIAKRMNNVPLGLLAGLVLVVILGGLADLNPFIGVACSLMVLVLAMVVSRPILIVYGLILALPLIGGMGRGAVVPLLRVGQAVLVVGFILFVLVRPSRLGKSRLTAIDLAFALFVLTEDIFPMLALYYRGEQLDLNDPSIIQVLLRPVQYYLLYRIVVATISSERQIKALLKLIFIASIIVSIIGILEGLGVSPVKTFLQINYPITIPGLGYDDANLRVGSTLGYYSALAAYLSFTIIVALTCYLAQERLKISPLLLAATILFDSIALVLTGTFTAWIGLIIGATIIFILNGRLPKTVILALVGFVLAAFIFQPFISARLDQQLGAGATQGLVPQSFAYRVRLWTELTLPQINQHLFFGAGPAPAGAFEDSQYIYLLLEGGLSYFLGYLLLMGVAIATCWQQIKSKKGDVGRLVAIATLAILVALNVMNVSEEYFTYIGSSQTLWILLAIVVASGQIKALEASAAAKQIVGNKLLTADRLSHSSQGITGASTAVGSVVGSYLAREKNQISSYSLIPNYIGLEVSRLDRLRQRFTWLAHLLDWHFVKDSVVVGAGSMIARALGLLIMTLLARFLTHDDFGFVRYSMTLAGVITIASYASPVSITRFLATNVNDQQARDRYFSTSLVGVAILLAASLLISVPILWLLHAFNLGTIIYMVGTAIPAYYLGVVRGLNNAWKIGFTYLLTNATLIVVLLVVLGFFGLRTITVTLAISGLANIAVPFVLELIRPMPLRFHRSLISKTVLLELARFALPIVVSTGSYALWTGIDLLLVQYLIPHATGSYAAAETLAGAFILVPSAIMMVLMPRVASMDLEKGKRYTAGAVLATLAISLTGLIIVYVWGLKLIILIFGQRYSDAYPPLLVLSAGVSIFSVFTILEGFIIGRGKPGLSTQAVIVAMVSTYATIFWLTAQLGTLGASLSVAIGAALGTVVMLFNTWRVLHSDNQVANSGISSGDPTLA